MNNTIDFNTAKTIGTMSKKIDHIDDTVSGFFSFMHMVMQNELGNAEPYFAAVSPVLDLTVIRPDDAPHILPCFDEADEGIGISEDEPLGFCYNPKQVIKLMGKRYLVGPVIFHRFDDERNFASLTMSDLLLFCVHFWHFSFPAVFRGQSRKVEPFPAHRQPLFNRCIDRSGQEAPCPVSFYRKRTGTQLAGLSAAKTGSC